MSLSLEDLRPKNFTITIQGVELECKPLKLSHTLTMASISDIFSNLKDSTPESIERADKEIQSLIADIIPSLNFELDGATTMEIITELVNSTTPSDVEYLNKNGVKLDASPKAEKVG